MTPASYAGHIIVHKRVLTQVHSVLFLYSHSAMGRQSDTTGERLTCLIACLPKHGSCDILFLTKFEKSMRIVGKRTQHFLKGTSDPPQLRTGAILMYSVFPTLSNQVYLAVF
ncbi:unnamed protein product [Chrysodeixis includens]|uniref:Uncharacterized protein n=1 Tax=Chrysodeixis includens TaxID=689277 RepID=A0A9N8L637_CHRIL|nr:unnamed protein product [Chrysodeixis includens]